MNEPTTQQRLATAIGTVIIPMFKTGDGINSGPMDGFLEESAKDIIARAEDYLSQIYEEKEP